MWKSSQTRPNSMTQIWQLENQKTIFPSFFLWGGCKGLWGWEEGVWCEAQHLLTYLKSVGGDPLGPV